MELGLSIDTFHPVLGPTGFGLLQMEATRHRSAAME